ncbi:MAG: antibiotic biosynthesis monooxygenase [Longimicrobiales bacterium]
MNKPEERFRYVWQYTIDPAHRDAFLAAYRPGGDWARLFAQAPGYVETLLLRDADRTDVYLTVDVWQSRDQCLAFRRRYAEEFSALDARCESYTLDERFVGDYLDVP